MHLNIFRWVERCRIYGRNQQKNQGNQKCVFKCQKLENVANKLL